MIILYLALFCVWYYRRKNHVYNDTSLSTSSIATPCITLGSVATSKRPTAMINVDKTSKTQNMNNTNNNNAYGVGNNDVNDDNDEMQILLNLERQTSEIVHLLQMGGLSTNTDRVVNCTSISNHATDGLCTRHTPNKNKSWNGWNKPTHRDDDHRDHNDTNESNTQGNTGSGHSMCCLQEVNPRLQWCCAAVSPSIHLGTTSSSITPQTEGQSIATRHATQNVTGTGDMVDGQKTNIYANTHHSPDRPGYNLQAPISSSNNNSNKKNQNKNNNVYNDDDTDDDNNNVGYKYEKDNINSDVDTTVQWRGRYSKLVKKYYRRVINDDVQLNDANRSSKSSRSQKTSKSKKCKKSSKSKQSKLLNTKKDKWRCVKCNLIIYTRSGLISHCNKHENVQKYTCKYCKRKFANRTSLIRHERIHTGERPFECNICNKKFVQKHALTLHKQTHDKIKNYQCDICLKRYTQSGSLRRHRKTIHHIENSNK